MKKNLRTLDFAEASQLIRSNQEVSICIDEEDWASANYNGRGLYKIAEDDDVATA